MYATGKETQNKDILESNFNYLHSITMNRLLTYVYPDFSCLIFKIKIIRKIRGHDICLFKIRKELLND